MANVAVVTCARKAWDSEGLQETLPPGCRLFEVVDAKSMGEGYNIGITRALAQSDWDAEVFVFTHTDVRIWASQRLWTDMAEKCMEPGVGFVGVAGSLRLEKNAAWWSQSLPDQLRGAVNHQTNGQTYCSAFGPYGGQCVVLDGVFLACSAKIFEKVGSWPENGWHFYDIRMTLGAHLAAGLKNYVVPLPLLHYSVGKPDQGWEAARRQFLSDNGFLLPVAV
jgi:hypothetical protein